MPKSVEECVSKIQGKNPRTGKPYTQSEKWAICTAAQKKKMKGRSEIEEVLEQESTAELNELFSICVEKLTRTNRAKTVEEAHSIFNSLLTKANYDVDILKLVFNKV